MALLATIASNARAVDGVWREPPPPVRDRAAIVYDRMLDRYVMVARDVWQTVAGADVPWWRIDDASDAPPAIQKALPSSSDSTRALFSTDSYFELWALALSPGEGWTSLLPTQGGPSLRMQTAAVYQATKARVVVFGGRGPHPTFGTVDWNDLWQVDLSATPVWRELHPAGSPPPAVNALAPAVLDEARQRMLILRAGQLWALDLGDSLAWSILPVTGVPALTFTQFVIDPARDRLIAYGTRTAAGVRVYELWSVPLTGGAFTKIGDTGPTSFWPGLALDARRDRLTGYDEDATWEFALNGGGWARLGGTRTGLEGRTFGFVVRDPLLPRWLVFDGADEAGPGAPPIQYATDGTRGWQPYESIGPAPPRTNPASGFAFDASRNEVICQRGVTMHRLDLATSTWTQENVESVPSGAQFKAWTVDGERDQLVVLGVTIDSVFQQPYTAAWTIPLGAGPKEFTELHPVGAAPATALQPSDTPVAFTDSLRDRVLYLGAGRQVWALNFASGGSSWQRLADFPASLRASTIGYDGAADRLYLFDSDLLNQVARIYEWPLAQSPATARIVVPFGAPAPLPAPGWFSTFDPQARSFLLLDGSVAFLEDRVDSTLGAELVVANCESLPNAMPGDSAALRIHLAGGSTGRTLGFALDCNRAWPGFPRAGKAWVAPGGATDLVEAIDVPDTAAAGPVTFTFTGAPAPLGCSIVLHVGGVEPVTIAATCPPPLTWIAGATAHGHLTATITGSAAATTLAWTLASARNWPGFPLGGTTSISGGAAAFDVDIAVPDTSTVGGNRIHVTFTPVGDSIADSCTWELYAPSSGEPPTGGAAVNVSPNPSHEGVTLRLGLDHDTDVRVEVRQLATGRLVYSKSLGRLDAGAYALPLMPQGALASGMYLVRTYVDGVPHDSKLVLLR